MKIKSFTMEVRPWRGSYGMDDVKELHFTIMEPNGKVRKYKETLSLELPDHLSLLDYIFEHAKKELVGHLKFKGG
jgi:hypothetical protein